MARKWYRLDNAALIFPAIMRKDWNNAFRLSATLTQDIDPVILSKAASDIKKRFPTFFVRLKTGFFWYYLEEIKDEIVPIEDFAYPLTHMNRAELKRSCLRILYHKNRIAIEVFHSVSDGNGGLVLLKNLVARYACLAHLAKPSATCGVLDINEEPTREELSDGFLENAAKSTISRNEGKSFHLVGTPEENNFKNIVTGIIPTDKLKEAAHDYEVSVTSFLAAVMIKSLLELQSKYPRNKKLVQLSIPVNLRKLYGVNTLRNFILPVYVGVDPRIGDYSISELCNIISHQLLADAIPQRMSARIRANVAPQNNIFIRLAPLFVKNFVMRLIYIATGERYGALNISNLGDEKLPDELHDIVDRLDFIIGVQYSYPNNASVISYNGKTCINMIRSIKESELERLFFSKLVELGIPVEIESNASSKKGR